MPIFLSSLLAGVLSILSAALLAQRGAAGIASIAAGSLFVVLSVMGFRRASTLLLWALLPLIGWLDVILPGSPAVPLSLGPVAGWIVSRVKCRVPWVFGLPILVWFLGSGWAVFRIWAIAGGNWKSEIARAVPWGAGPLLAINAAGWAALSFVSQSAGPLLAGLWIGDSRSGETVSILGRWTGILFLPIAVFGALQSFGVSHLFGPSPFSGSGRLSASFVDPNAMAMYLALTIPLWLGWVSSEMSGRGLAYAAALWTVCPFVFLLASGTRSALLSLVVSGIVFLVGRMKGGRLSWVQKSRAVTFVAVLSVLAFCAVSLLPFSVTSFGRMIGPMQKLWREEIDWMDAISGKDSRFQMWGRALEMAANDPARGIGTGLYLMQARRAETSELSTPNDNPGSQYLQWMVENGVFGLLAIMACGVLIWRKGWESVGSALFLSASASCAGTAAALLFGSHLMRLEVTVVFWFLLAVAYGSERR